MSGWATVLGEGLAVLGLAIGLATLSYAHYEAREQGKRLREAHSTPLCRAGGNLTAILLGLGLALSSRLLAERFAWIICVLLYVVLAARPRHAGRNGAAAGTPTDGPGKLRG